MAEAMGSQVQRHPLIRVAALFIEWVSGAAALGGVALAFHGWNDGGPYLLGAVFVGVIGFLAHAACIYRGGA
jgi:hypothetical protein